MQVSRKPITLVFISPEFNRQFVRMIFLKADDLLVNVNQIYRKGLYFTYRRSDWRNDEHLFFHFVCL